MLNELAVTAHAIHPHDQERDVSLDRSRRLTSGPRDACKRSDVAPTRWGTNITGSGRTTDRRDFGSYSRAA